ncbi:TonB-dependent receptor [uncultured Bacteroides sp.]|uniref:SusC/RagA family TonB-linked outer membrane protein n=1 Tax=uncultured Bacteroides sp. TaxID=162156 RepID=UPI002AA63DBF|nr:TonB-dependent receptor [uncultured Bacteroides sp.]
MNNRKKRGLANSKSFITVTIVSLLIVGSGTATANQTVSGKSYEAAEQLQAQTINGVVVDANGETVIGASVIEKGTTNGIVTDIDGKFTLNVKLGVTLQISFVGFQTQEVKATRTMKIILKEDTELLDEVVVVGYGTQKKANLTGAVSTVDVGKTLEARPQSDITKALQGVVPGLSIINTSGKLNSQPTITIRGTGTLSNDAKSNPLIIVDGVPMDDISYLNTQDIQNISVLKDAASTSIYGTRAAFGVILITTKSAKKTDKVTVNYTNNFSWDTPTILPNYPDVASQAKALRAANLRAGLSNELFGMVMDDSFISKAEGWKERHGGKAGYREMVPGDDFDLAADGSALYYADWDVVGIMFRNWKPGQSHNLSVQGTSGKTSYFMSMGYNHEEGVMTFNPDQLDKYNATMNVTSDITNWLQVGGRFSYSDKDYTTPNTRRDTYTYMWRWGSFFGPYGTYQGTDMRNDIAYLKQAGDDKTNDSYTRIGTFLKATITKGLTLNADYTLSLRNSNEKSAGLPVTCWNSWGGKITTPTILSSGTSTYVYQESIKDQSYALNVYANYELSLAKMHHFNFMIGTNAEEGEYESDWAQRKNLLDGNMPEFNLATGDQTVGGSHSEWGTAGWFGRINYDYNGIWLLEMNGRYDGSSKFPASDRWAFFPSGSVGYRISEEKYFMPLKKVINNVKLRASYGEIGNQAIGDNMFISTLSKETDSNVHWLDDGGNKVVSYDLPSLVSAKLKWERIQTLDLGTDLGFLNNELSASFDWYQRTTKDMLAPGQAMPQTLGASAPKINAGTLRTRGWELAIDWHHLFNKVTVYANASIGDFKTVITKWDDDSKLLNSNYSGKNYGDIWGFETDRYFTANDFNADGSYKEGVASQAGLEQSGFVYGPGDVKFKNLNGDNVIDGGKGTADDHGDLKVIGNTTPRYQYSFRLGGEWKGFDIDMFFQGIGKRDVWTQSAFVMPMMRGADAIYANQTNYWTEENPNPSADFPRMWPGNAGQGNISVIDKGNHNFYPQSKYLVNMAYLRFKNLTIGYTLPKIWTRKAYMDKVRVYFSANNLCELINNSNAPVDPEIDTSEAVALGETNDYGNGTWGRVDPMYRTISFGLQVTF